EIVCVFRLATAGVPLRHLAGPAVDVEAEAVDHGVAAQAEDRLVRADLQHRSAVAADRAGDVHDARLGSGDGRRQRREVAHDYHLAALAPSRAAAQRGETDR